MFGFIAATFLSSFETLTPLDLDISNYNPDIENGSVKNPTPFNKGGSFPCQPGRCVSFYDEYLGTYCAASVFPNETCYGIDVTEIGDAMEGKLNVIDQDVTTVKEVRT